VCANAARASSAVQPRTCAAPPRSAEPPQRAAAAVVTKLAKPER
jgi:hypothetical protein